MVVSAVSQISGPYASGVTGAPPRHFENASSNGKNHDLTTIDMNKEDKLEIIRAISTTTEEERVKAYEETNSVKAQKAFLDTMAAALQSKADGLAESIRRLGEIERRVSLGEL